MAQPQTMLAQETSHAHPMVTELLAAWQTIAEKKQVECWS